MIEARRTGPSSSTTITGRILYTTSGDVAVSRASSPNGVIGGSVSRSPKPGGATQRTYFRQPTDNSSNRFLGDNAGQSAGQHEDDDHQGDSQEDALEPFSGSQHLDDKNADGGSDDRPEDRTNAADDRIRRDEDRRPQAPDLRMHDTVVVSREGA